MKDKPVTLKNAPMEYAPANELGVVFLFAHVARRLQFRIEEGDPPSAPGLHRLPENGRFRKEVQDRVRVQIKQFQGSPT
ncbi:MAG: hypothetical protein CV087_07750 [Candidatus Brocadia sp. WS118]|nr:MAG: hypothetical protein CV087_07750 [Candidatus Brocadia sp. WS118]